MATRKVLQILDILGKKVSDLPSIEGTIPFNNKLVVADQITGQLFQADRAQLKVFIGGGGSGEVVAGEATYMTTVF